MPNLEPEQDPYGLTPATDPLSAPADEPEAMPMPNQPQADLALDDAQPAPPFAEEQQRRREAGARSLAALDAAVAQMDRDRAPPARNARAALDHIDAPDRYAHHIETGKSAVRLRARLAGQPDAQAEAAANDYQSAIHLAHVDARASDDAIGALVAIRRHGAEMRPEDKHKALAGTAPRFADERAIADVEAGDLAAAPFAPLPPKMSPDDLRDRMLAISPDEQQAVLPALLQRYKGDAARSWAAAALGPDKLDALIAQHGDSWYPALPEDVRVDVAQHIAFLGARGSKRALPADPTAAATRIVNQPGVDDERRQKALDELNWRMMQADRTRQTASANAAAEADALANELDDSFTSIAQIPPTVRRELSKGAVDRLVERAARTMAGRPRVGTPDLPLTTHAGGNAGPYMPSGAPSDYLHPDSVDPEAARNEADPWFEPLNAIDDGENIGATTSADSGMAIAEPPSTDGDAPGDSADPYGGLRDLVKRSPGGGDLEDAGLKTGTPTPRARPDLARRWQILTAEQRLQDPELRNAARAVNAARTLLYSDDPDLLKFLGAKDQIIGPAVKGVIMRYIEEIIAPRAFIRGTIFNAYSDQDLRTGGAKASLLYGAVREANARALNHRQQQALDFFIRARCE